jgi:hypothetical protein
MAVVGNGDERAIVSCGERRDTIRNIRGVKQWEYLEALGCRLLGLWLWLRGRFFGRCAATSKCSYATQYCP